MSNHELFNSVRRALLSNGFEQVKKKGAGGHYYFRKEGLKITLSHGMHDRGMARKILKNQAGIEPRGIVP